MTAKIAAGFCGEPSVDSFLDKVKRGIYSAPNLADGCMPKWHRLKLERDIAIRHGLLSPMLAEDIRDLI